MSVFLVQPHNKSCRRNMSTNDHSAENIVSALSVSPYKIVARFRSDADSNFVARFDLFEAVTFTF